MSIKYQKNCGAKSIKRIALLQGGATMTWANIRHNVLIYGRNGWSEYATQEGFDEWVVMAREVASICASVGRKDLVVEVESYLAEKAIKNCLKF